MQRIGRSFHFSFVECNFSTYNDGVRILPIVPKIYNVILYSFNCRLMHISPHRSDPLCGWPEAIFTSHIIMMRATRDGAQFCSVWIICLLSRIRNHVACLQPVYGLQSNHLHCVNKTYILVLAYSEFRAKPYTLNMWCYETPYFVFSALNGTCNIRLLFVPSSRLTYLAWNSAKQKILLHTCRGLCGLHIHTDMCFLPIQTIFRAYSL